MLTKLSSKQQMVLNFYKDFINAYGHAPTYREAWESLGINPSVVFSHVKNLVKKSYLSSQDWTVHLISNMQKIPLLWSAACGSPITIYEEVLDFIEVPLSILQWEWSFYALQAKWDSMIKAWIRDGDTLLVRQQSDINNGDIAVVVIPDTFDEKVTIKRVYKSKNGITLKPENDDMESQIVSAWEIRWKIISVIRKYD